MAKNCTPLKSEMHPPNGFLSKLEPFAIQFMNDNDRRERDLALFMDIVLLSKCAELWVFGEKITSGMSIEIEKAKRKGQLIRYFTESCEEVRR